MKSLPEASPINSLREHAEAMKSLATGINMFGQQLPLPPRLYRNARGAWIKCFPELNREAVRGTAAEATSVKAREALLLWNRAFFERPMPGFGRHRRGSLYLRKGGVTK
jgi:hypothetical protein